MGKTLCAQQQMVVSVALADVRHELVPAPKGIQGPAMSGDIGKQETQVYFGEPISAELIPDNPDWMKVSIMDQSTWNSQKQTLTTCSGYMRTKQLQAVSSFPKPTIILQNLWTPLYEKMDASGAPLMTLGFGTQLEAQKINGAWYGVQIDGKTVGYISSRAHVFDKTKPSTDQISIREKIITHAQKFLQPQTPYVWGGRSPISKDSPNQITGIDCSAFTELIHLAEGINIPRSSKAQYQASIKIEKGADLQPGDLLFFAKDTLDLTVNHVLMYFDDNHIIESFGHPELHKTNAASEKKIPLALLGVKITDIKKLIGCDAASIESGKTKTLDGRYVFLGTFLKRNK